MRPQIVALLASSLLFFAGCTGDTPSDPASTSESSSAGPTTDSVSPSETVAPTSEPPSGGGSGGSGPTNTAPSAALSADVMSGSAPLEVVFSISGEDAEGDPLSWSITVGGTETGNGSTVPATSNHSFEEVGDHLVVLTISDGSESATAELTISVAAPDDPNAGLPPPIVLTGKTVVPDPTGDVSQCKGYIQPGFGGDEFALTEDVWGWTFTVDSDKYITNFWQGVESKGVQGHTGIIPADATHIDACTGEPTFVDHAYTITLTHPEYVTPA